MLSSRATAKLKILLLGDKDVGKAVWLRRLLGEKSISYEVEELVAGWDLGIIKDVQVGEVTAEFICTNASVDPRFEKIVDYRIEHQDACLIFYNISSRQSFDNAVIHLDRARRKAKSGDIVLVLMGLHFGGYGQVSEEEAANVAVTAKALSCYGINPQIETNQSRLLYPLQYIAQHASAIKINVPQLDFKSCIKAVDHALRFSSDEDRTRLLKEFKKMMEDFSCFGEEVIPVHFAEMQRECCEIVQKAQIILESASPERVKLAVLAAATTVLLVTAAVCGLALLNVLTLPILTGVLIAGCALAGAGGLTTLGFTIFKAKENAIYSSLVTKAERVVQDFPGVRLASKQE